MWGRSREGFVDLMNVIWTKKYRIWSLVIVTLVLAGVIGFLLYTSEDPHWGSGFWTRWLSNHLQMRFLTARHIVNGIRKVMHFLGYGGIGLLCWFYLFFCPPLTHPMLFPLDRFPSCADRRMGPSDTPSFLFLNRSEYGRQEKPFFYTSFLPPSFFYRFSR